MRRIIAACALAIGSILAFNTSPASASLACPFGSSNMNNGYACADADFITGQGRVLVRLSNIDSTGYYFKMDIQTKTGTNGWVTRCTTNETKAPQYCTGSAGFATMNPPNTLVRVKAWHTSTSYSYWDVPVVQV